MFDMVFGRSKGGNCEAMDAILEEIDALFHQGVMEHAWPVEVLVVDVFKGKLMLETISGSPNGAN